MFKLARLKLTLLYLLIIMAVSILFSLVIYQVQSEEAERVLLRQRTLIENHGFLRPGFPTSGLGSEIVEEARNRLRLNLVFINLGVLMFSGGLAYFLAGRTLKPIEEMVEDQKRFIADASHELRTPLTTIKTEIEVNLRDKALSKEAKKVLESNLQEVDKLSYLADKLLRLSRYEQKQEFTIATTSLKEVLEKAIDKNAASAKSKKIRIVKSLGETIIQGDFTALVEAFGNILDNAVKYSPVKSKITVELQDKTDSAVVAIKDSGLGIEPAALPNIFRRFYRADPARGREPVAGFGLGLAITKTILNKHQGKIDVESTPGSGTTFTIMLPKKQKLSAFSQLHLLDS